MFCQNCGNELPEGAAFCPECGAKVPENVTTEPETAVETAPPTMETEKAESIASETAAAMAATSQSAYQAIKKEETWKEKYFSFQGRLNRKRYILRSIVNNLVSHFLNCILAVISFVFSGESDIIHFTFYGEPDLLFGISIIVCILSFVAGVSLSVRRLHDLNRSGFFFLLFFIPIVNFFLGIYIIFFKGTEGDNRYGSDPLARGNGEQ